MFCCFVVFALNRSYYVVLKRVYLAAVLTSNNAVDDRTNVYGKWCGKVPDSSNNSRRKRVVYLTRTLEFYFFVEFAHEVAH